MKIKPGVRLRSVVCATEVIVVVAPDDDIPLECGGQPMDVIEAGGRSTDRAGEGQIEPPLVGGTLLGKRYVAEDLGLQLLCTKAGKGTLAVGGQPMGLQNSKPLPSSD